MEGLQLYNLQWVNRGIAIWILFVEQTNDLPHTKPYWRHEQARYDKLVFWWVSAVFVLLFCGVAWYLPGWCSCAHTSTRDLCNVWHLALQAFCFIFFYKQLSRDNDDKVEGDSGAKLRLETNIVLSPERKHNSIDFRFSLHWARW